MKSAFLLSEDAELVDKVSKVLGRHGAPISSDKVIQLSDERGRLLTIFGELDPAFDWEWRDGPIVMFDGSPTPPVASMTACVVECRWEDLFASTMAVIAAGVAENLWVLDGDGVLWPAQAVDPGRVRL